MTAATIRVRTPSGAPRTFQAERVDVDHGLVTASGIWRDTRDRRRRTLSWASAQIVEIRWTHERVTA